MITVKQLQDSHAYVLILTKINQWRRLAKSGEVTISSDLLREICRDLPSDDICLVINYIEDRLKAKLAELGIKLD